MKTQIVVFEQDNKLIASFLGQTSTNYEFPQYEFQQFGYIKSNGDWEDTFWASELKFHSDWNWLMEVVEKIESKGFDVHINTCVCRISDVGEDRFEDIETFNSNNKIQAVYSGVVEFIKWYNNQTN